MSAIRFLNTEKGNLPNLFYILCNQEPQGRDLNAVACSITRDFLFIGIHRGKDETKNRDYHLQLGATASCKKRTAEEKNE